MTIIRVLVGGAVIAFCAGFIPVGGCAKGCGAAGKVGAGQADDIARLSVHSTTRYGDDLARAGRYGDDLGTAGRYRPGVAVGGVGHAGDDLAFASRMELESAARALPEPEGAMASFARTPTPSGTKLDLDDAGRTFGKDYAKAADDLGVTKKQHEGLMDAFEKAQEVAEPLIEALGGDEEPGADADAIRASIAAREKMQELAASLNLRLAEILTPEQLGNFRATLGEPVVVAYRLGKDRPVQQAKPKRTSDKVAP